ncbi:HalD/BesD family halogenase [Chitinasiproducens palmae]
MAPPMAAAEAAPSAVPSMRASAEVGTVDPDRAVAARVADFDAAAAKARFDEQGAFLFIEDFLPPEVTRGLIDCVRAVQSQANRNYLPGHKQGGSVSRHVIDEAAPFIAELYRSPALIGWLERLTGDRLLPSPDDDPHAYALYFYTRAGDHIGWHYDTSYYDGKRYTLLLGVIDDSSCLLEYRLHTRDEQRANVSGAARLRPGGFILFDGDKLHHRVTRLKEGEERVSLTFEYVTDPTLRGSRRVLSNLKDAVAYFGFRQVFRGMIGRRREPARRPDEPR